MRTHNCCSIFVLVSPYLCRDDDPAFWREVIITVLSDIESDALIIKSRKKLFLRIGVCSRWLRPHQARWKAAGGFAWPTGYLGARHSRQGLPELDWSVVAMWNAVTESWEPTDSFDTKDALVCRIALPARTKRHNQAAIHMVWIPGAPGSSTAKSVRFYGFRKRVTKWACVASTDDE